MLAHADEVVDARQHSQQRDENRRPNEHGRRLPAAFRTRNRQRAYALTSLLGHVSVLNRFGKRSFPEFGRGRRRSSESSDISYTGRCGSVIMGAYAVQTNGALPIPDAATWPDAAGSEKAGQPDNTAAAWTARPRRRGLLIRWRGVRLPGSPQPTTLDAMRSRRTDHPGDRLTKLMLRAIQNPPASTGALSGLSAYRISRGGRPDARPSWSMRQYPANSPRRTRVR
jgi:hypothetical protein